MSFQTTCTHVRANFASLCNKVAQDRKVVLINRRNAEDVALIAASELSCLLEIAHLLRSPKNAQRLLAALKYLASGAWSRRLTEEHRIVYLVQEGRIDFLQARYHY